MDRVKMKITRRHFLKTSMAGTVCLSFPFSLIEDKEHKRRPNILWITSEDNSPMLGCYGDQFATTPNLDRFASEGILYENAFANAPVCAPTRFTIITGTYACSMGTHHMRSRYEVPASLASTVRAPQRGYAHAASRGHAIRAAASSHEIVHHRVPKKAGHRVSPGSGEVHRCLCLAHSIR